MCVCGVLCVWCNVCEMCGVGLENYTPLNLNIFLFTMSLISEMIYFNYKLQYFILSNDELADLEYLLCGSCSVVAALW